MDYPSGDELFDKEAIVHYALMAESDPITFEEEIIEIKWHKSMKREIQAIERNHAWELTSFPKRKKVIDVIWIYKTKIDKTSVMEKHKREK